MSVPETLEELTPAQYYRYLEIATMANQHILSEPGIRLKILSLFLALPVDMGHLPPSTWKETLALLSLTDPFVIREGKSFRLDLSTGINLLPEWNGFHGPEDMLNGVSFDTFCKCDFRAVKVKECEAVKKSKKLLKFVLDDGTGTDRVPFRNQLDRCRHYDRGSEQEDSYGAGMGMVSDGSGTRTRHSGVYEGRPCPYHRG